MNSLKKYGLVASLTTAVFGLGVAATPASAITAADIGYSGSNVSVTEADGEYTLTLDGDAVQDLVVQSGESVTLDLNGHSLTNYTAACETIYVQAGGTLEITGEGTVTQKSDSTNTVIRNEGSLLIDDGVTVEEVNTVTGVFSPAVANSGDMMIKEATIKQAGDYYAVQTYGTGYTAIYGATISSDSTTTALIGNHDAAGSFTVIDGGVFTTSHYAVLNYSGAATAILDGKFSGKIWSENDEILEDEEDESGIIVTGGTYDQKVKPGYVYEGMAEVEKDGKYYVLYVDIAAGEDEESGAPAGTSDNEAILAGELAKKVSEYFANGAADGLSIKNAEALVETLLNGDTLSVVAETSELSADEADGASKIAAKAETLGGTVASYFEINLSIYAGNGDYVGTMTEIGSELSFTLEIPEDVRMAADGYTRTFYIVRYHDGVAEVIAEATDVSEISFTSDEFSTFALVYADTKKATSPDTGAATTESGSASTSGVIVAAATGATIAGGIALTLRRKVLEK